MIDWQPIEALPEDGTRVLCWRDGEIDTAWWREGVFGEWGLGGHGWSYPEWDMPTHWAPMPAGPLMPSAASPPHNGDTP